MKHISAAFLLRLTFIIQLALWIQLKVKRRKTRDENQEKKIKTGSEESNSSQLVAVTDDLLFSSVVYVKDEQRIEELSSKDHR